MFIFETPTQTPEQNERAARLYSLLSKAVMLKRMEVNIGEWRPSQNECHSNVTQIHLHDSSYTPVRGWLYFDFDGAFDCVQFLAHSAIRAHNGELWDVTPSMASREYPFIADDSSEEAFATLIENGVIRLWHVL